MMDGDCICRGATLPSGGRLAGGAVRLAAGGALTGWATDFLGRGGGRAGAGRGGRGGVRLVWAGLRGGVRVGSWDTDTDLRVPAPAGPGRCSALRDRGLRRTGPSSEDLVLRGSGGRDN